MHQIMIMAVMVPSEDDNSTQVKERYRRKNIHY